MVEYSNVRGLVYDNGLKDLNIGRVIDIFFEKNAEFYESSQDEVCFMVEIERISEQIKSRKGRIAECKRRNKSITITNKK